MVVKDEFETKNKKTLDFSIKCFDFYYDSYRHSTS
nr:MAG TPA: hypothetical protein [Caudoviricetes sp.]